MTDDDRMDRAERIKRMREGRREDDPAEASSDADTSASEGTDTSASEGPDASASEGPDASASEGTDSPPDPDRGSVASDPDGSTSETVDGPVASEATDSADAADEARSEAMETAKRVAESVTGLDADEVAAAGADAVDSGAVDPDEHDPESVDPADNTGESTETGDSDETVATRVLEFQLGDERYCLDIDYVEEIVKDEAITRVPNTSDIVDGVVDLRGQITTILDPKEVIDVDSGSAGSLIVVFDAEAVEDQGAIGWLVDEVHQVGPIAEADLRDSPVEEPYINGVIDRDDQFVLWIEPDLALDAIDED